MSDLPENLLESRSSQRNSDESQLKLTCSDSEQKFNTESAKSSLLANFLASTFSIFETRAGSLSKEDKVTKTTSYRLTAAMTTVMISGSMRRLQDCILGTTKTEALSSTSDIWLLGKCYKVSEVESSGAQDPSNGYADFLEDFSSRIWITYRKGFDLIGDSKFTSDASWGCMIRSSQMLVAQALLFHHLGRSWRKPSQKPYDPKYIEILHLFGDSEACAFSIHNLLQAGRHYRLAAGSWIGPYAMCKTWETIARANREQTDLDKGKERLPMVVYIVSGDEDGEQGGAPVVCIDIAARLCSSFSMSEGDWAPILLLVPLVLGLEKVNPRYIPLLRETFTFPQSLGILGGKPGLSTYIVGVQEDKGLYLDPHEVQPRTVPCFADQRVHCWLINCTKQYISSSSMGQAVDIKRDNLEADCTSYHCRTVRHMLLDQIDPSLAIGFYCRDKDDFEDFCSRASQLGEKSNGAPLFTITQFTQPTKPVPCGDASAGSHGGSANCVISDTFDLGNPIDDNLHPGEDEWQIL